MFIGLESDYSNEGHKAMSVNESEEPITLTTLENNSEVIAHLFDKIFY